MWDLVCLGNKYIHVVWMMPWPSLLSWQELGNMHLVGRTHSKGAVYSFFPPVLGFHCWPDHNKPAVGAPKRERTLWWVRCDVCIYTFKWEMEWKLSPAYCAFVFPAARLFHQAFISFRNYIMQSHSLDVDIHIILNDICFSAGKCLETIKISLLKYVEHTLYFFACFMFISLVRACCFRVGPVYTVCK